MTESFGKYLSQQRELRAMSREEIAKATRITLAHIAALEDDRLEDLPGEAFVVGFIRGYAECIGLNVDDTVLRFQEQHPATEGKTKARSRTPGRTRAAIFAILLLVGFIAGWILSRH